MLEIVLLKKEDEIEFGKIFAEIKEILEKPKPPVVDKKNICKKCAYYEFCFV